MKLSKRGEYGLKALIDLASSEPEAGIIKIKDIAAREQIPVKFLEQILLNLKNAGLLHSKKGIGGGYYLAKPPAAITLGQVVRVLDGTLAPIRCVSKIAYERCVCPDEATCGLRLTMLDVRNAIADVLDHTTLADVARRVQGAQRHSALASTKTRRRKASIRTQRRSEVHR